MLFLFNQNDQSAGIGGIVRENQGGQMIVAFSKAIIADTPLESELQALFHGLIICEKEGIYDLLIEADFLTILKSLDYFQNLPWKYMKLWKSILQKLRLRFPLTSLVLRSPI